MDEKELTRLLDRYRRGMCDEAERRLVESLHLHTYESNPMPDDAIAKRRVWKNLKGGLQPSRTYTLVTRIAVAASLLIMATIALLYNAGVEDRPTHQVVDIRAGGNKAMLKLADGQILSLDTSQSGIVMLDGRMIYTDSTFVGNVHNVYADDAYNEIVTPRGGIYQVVLEDGTKVWINSDSKLRFPPRFAQSRREVTLEGEAYFDVSENPNRPFVIKTAGQEIQVLGTSFNVAAYSDGPPERTTLVEGRIVVSTSQQAYQLSPGEQAIVSDNGMSINQVDTSPFVAWKSGFFAFNEETLAHIMRDISRWYDVDVHFEGADTNLRFGGMVSRYANVSEVLRRLELTGQVHFKIEERGIVVRQ